MNKKDGGPAFSVPADNYSGGEIFQSEPGMSLRDYFAIHASDKDIETYLAGTQRTFIDREQARYKFADAMLEAREK